MIIKVYWIKLRIHIWDSASHSWYTWRWVSASCVERSMVPPFGFPPCKQKGWETLHCGEIIQEFCYIFVVDKPPLQICTAKLQCYWCTAAPFSCRQILFQLLKPFFSRSTLFVQSIPIFDMSHPISRIQIWDITCNLMQPNQHCNSWTIKMKMADSTLWPTERSSS